MNGLLAAAGWVLDVVFFVLLILGTLLGTRRGFVGGLLKIATTWFALLFALMFCVSFANFLELCFHMTSGITTGISGALAGDAAYAAGLPTDIAGAQIDDALAQMDIGAFQRWLISTSFASVEVIPAGTTPATLLASVLAKWISIVIAFVLLIVLLKFGAFLLSKGFNALKEWIAPLRIVDQALGAVLGLLKAFALIFIVLLLLNWLPFDGLHAFISDSTIVGGIFRSDWFQNATSYAISGQWFSDYILKIIPN